MSKGAARKTPKKRQNVPIAVSAAPRTTFRAHMTHDGALAVGTDYVGTVELAANREYVAGDTITYGYVGLSAMANTRLYALSRLYEKYRFRSLTIHVAGAQSATYGGQFVVAFDSDPSDQTYTGEQNLHWALAAKASGIMKPWENRSFSIPGDRFVELFTDRGADPAATTQNDQRLYNSGFWEAVCVTPFEVHDTTQVLASVYVSYEVELRIPQLETASPATYIIEHTQTSGPASGTTLVNWQTLATNVLKDVSSWSNYSGAGNLSGETPAEATSYKTDAGLFEYIKLPPGTYKWVYELARLGSDYLSLTGAMGGGSIFPKIGVAATCADGSTGNPLTYTSNGYLCSVNDAYKTASGVFTVVKNALAKLVVTTAGNAPMTVTSEGTSAKTRSLFSLFSVQSPYHNIFGKGKFVPSEGPMSNSSAVRLWRQTPDGYWYWDDDSSQGKTASYCTGAGPAESDACSEESVFQAPVPKRTAPALAGVRRV